MPAISRQDVLAPVGLSLTVLPAPAPQVLEAPHHDAISAFKQTVRRQLGVNEVEATDPKSCASVTKAIAVFPFVEELFNKVSGDVFTVRG